MTYSVEQHLDNKEPIVAQIYSKLISSLKEFGELHEVAKGGSIHLDNKTGFCGVYTRKDYLLLHFRLTHQVQSSRIEKCEQISKNRFKHTVKLTSENEVDNELLGWLKDAYALSG